MSTISAGTTSTTAFKVTSDTTGTLVLQTGAVPTTAISISSSQVVTFPATTTLDFTGTLLLGDGSATAPTLAHSGDTNTGIYFPGADQIAITTGGSQKFFVGTSLVINEGGLDFDTRIEGDTDANLVFVDASADAVGVGTSSPGGKFNIVKAKSGTSSESYDLLRLNLSGTAAIGDSMDVVWYNGSTKVASINGILGADNALYGTLAFSTRSYNTDTLVEAVRINNRSNVGIGTTSPSGRLHVATSSGNCYVYSARASKSTGQVAFQLSGGTSGTDWIIYQPTNSDNLTFFGNSGDRMVLDTSGNLGVGTSSPGGRLHVVSADNTNTTVIGSFDAANQTQRIQIGFQSIAQYSASDPIRFLTNGLGGSERARITEGGNFLVGTTSSSLPSQGFALIPSSDSVQRIGHANGTGTGSLYVQFGYNSGEIGSVTQSGTTAVAYNTTSDRRLKNNIVSAPDAGAKIDAIEIVSHGWKSAPDENVEYGVIAQDLALVAPQAVTAGNDGDEIEKIWGVDYSKLVPMLVKEVQSLRARLAALEAK